MFITGIGTATPRTRYTQAECWEAIQQAELFTRISPRSRALLRKVLNAQNGIESRSLALDPLTEAFELNPDALHARFAKHAPRLASQAAERALARAGLTPSDIDVVVISTCTGYLCPGLTSYVTEQLGLRPDVFALDLVGHGCGAAVPNLRTAESLLAAGRGKHALSICVEVCSAALYFDDDPGVLISACLFGDGAGAAVLSRDEGSGRSLKWHAASTFLSAGDRDLLRFEQRGGMLRNILTPPVPSLAAKHSRALFAKVAESRGLKANAMSQWIWHAGGRDVLGALRSEFGFANGELDHSTAVLRELGNISSACVYHVLERALAANAPAGWWWLSAFGAGFSCHGALLEAQ
jgi:predicted naringenin-chalcone synthase